MVYDEQYLLTEPATLHDWDNYEQHRAQSTIHLNKSHDLETVDAVPIH